ncbi:vWA domain-containing protein [Demequina rhizosphaerae]|uniref:vWA domain-containing protein n=1 Tax=Demequina rhizosphaerae TaxID=1638985 RepID=UPI0007819BD8|nr:VWA domain-containing protein [Demequina rhizosphaerae]
MHINAILDVDVAALEADDTVTVMLELEAPAAPDADNNSAELRPAHTAIVVLDRSGSMAGDRLDHAKEALLSLVDRLSDDDRFGLVTFDSQAQVVVPAGLVGDLGRARIRHDIATVEPGGMTDLSSGYLRGLQEARRVCTEAGATIILLSDGHANTGITDPVKLASVAGKASKQAISTSTIGIGLGYDEVILTEMAGAGLGNHAFAEHAEAAAVAVAGEIDGLLSKTVQAASLLVTPSEDVSGVTVLNDGLPQQAVEGGILVELGDLYAGETRRVTVAFDVPGMPALGLAQVADLAISYVELATLDQHTVTVPVSVNVVPADVARGRVPDPRVEQEKLLLSAQRSKREAEGYLRAGDIAGAASVIGSMSATLSSAPKSDMLADEAAWFAESMDSLTTRGAEATSRRLSSDRMRKSRGFTGRAQGGEVQEPPASGGASASGSPSSGAA